MATYPRPRSPYCAGASWRTSRPRHPRLIGVSRKSFIAKIAGPLARGSAGGVVVGDRNRGLQRRRRDRAAHTTCCDRDAIRVAEAIRDQKAPAHQE